MTGPLIVAGALLICAAGGVGGFFVRQFIASRRALSIEARLKKLAEDARTEAKEILIEAKEKSVKLLEEAKSEERDRIATVRRLEERAIEREGALDKRMEEARTREHDAEERIEKVKVLKAEWESKRQQAEKELERISGLTREDAVKEIVAHIEKNHTDDIMMRIKKMEHTGMDEMERKAHEILATIIQRLAAPTTSEVTTTAVAIPSDDLKGKIIGREGRNIKALERAAGVEIIVDETPGAIIVSGFDPIRRQVARVAIETLLKDGRIQPARIEEAVEKARNEIEKQVKQAAEQAAYEVGVFDLDPRLLILLGRLRFRTSYGQNVLQHSVEMAHLAGMLAEELGADVVIAKKGALLHDIGKAVDHEVAGTHVEIGRRILQKFNVDTRVIQAMQSHHEEYPYETIESVIVQTVDAVSASRPGARRDSVENYLKRLEDLEKIAASFAGVEKAYAISAGREIRVFVTPEKVSDLEARDTARAIALRVESELKYPGEIKVTVIRESRVIEYAR
jgi:ribonuclease Y